MDKTTKTHPWMPSAKELLTGSDKPLPLHNQHHVHGHPLHDEFTGHEKIYFGMGCFWGAERRLWQQSGVHTTAVGYAGGGTSNPTYKQVCTGQTGHAEVVQVIYSPQQTTLQALLQTFWESHDPTQGMRQGGDVGTQYRSVILCTTAQQHQQAMASLLHYQQMIGAQRQITTHITYPAPAFYFAEDEHQQYLSKNPQGYCGLGGLGTRYLNA